MKRGLQSRQMEESEVLAQHGKSLRVPSTARSLVQRFVA
jgi:hypothetical protein